MTEEIPMFSLRNHNTTLAHLNVRTEKHGEDHVTAVDLKLAADVHSSVLDSFDASLRPFLFRPAAVGEQQPLIGEDGLTGIRMPSLKPLVLDDEFGGYRLEIESGLGLKEPLVLTVDLKRFKFEAREGGTVSLEFTASCHPDGDEVKALYELLGEDLGLTLTPPQAEGQAQADDQREAA